MFECPVCNEEFDEDERFCHRCSEECEIPIACGHCGELMALEDCADGRVCNNCYCKIQGRVN